MGLWRAHVKSPTVKKLRLLETSSTSSALLCPGVSSPSVREGVQGQAGPGATEEILIIAGEGRHEGHQQGGDGVDEAPDSDVGHGEKLASTGCWNPVLRININGEVRAAGRLSGTGATRS